MAKLKYLEVKNVNPDNFAITLSLKPGSFEKLGVIWNVEDLGPKKDGFWYPEIVFETTNKLVTEKIEVPCSDLALVPQAYDRPDELVDGSDVIVLFFRDQKGLTNAVSSL